MLVKYHVILGAIASAIIYFIFQITPIQATIIFLASFLIDVDHYLIYIFDKKEINFNNAHKWFLKRRNKWIKLNPDQKNKTKRAIFIFHGIEFVFILIIFSFFIPIVKFILFGVLIHLILDYIDIIYYKDKLYSKMSQIYVILTNKDKKEF